MTKYIVGTNSDTEHFVTKDKDDNFILTHDVSKATLFNTYDEAATASVCIGIGLRVISF